ncbi:hypothetical protein AAMO2058_000608400 [Amorphochlora amoebiformis]
MSTTVWRCHPPCGPIHRVIQAPIPRRPPRPKSSTKRMADRKTQLLEKKYPLAPMARNEKEKRSKEAVFLFYILSQVDLSRKEVGNVLSLKLSNDDGFGKFSAFDSIPAEEIRDPDTKVIKNHSKFIQLNESQMAQGFRWYEVLIKLPNQKEVSLANSSKAKYVHLYYKESEIFSNKNQSLYWPYLYSLKELKQYLKKLHDSKTLTDELNLGEEARKIAEKEGWLEKPSSRQQCESCRRLEKKSKELKKKDEELKKKDEELKKKDKQLKRKEEEHKKKFEELTQKLKERDQSHQTVEYLRKRSRDKSGNEVFNINMLCNFSEVDSEHGVEEQRRKWPRVANKVGSDQEEIGKDFKYDPDSNPISSTSYLGEHLFRITLRAPEVIVAVIELQFS